jgi:two-component sensor histidine kinase/DNA-binding response OmpR family regulator
MKQDGKINILLVDDQPGKLLSYEVILAGLDANLIKANSATEALALLLKNDVAVVLVDVCMPDFDGFQLAQMIREHPRFQHTAMIFISAVQISEVDHVRGYALGAVDYVPVPVVPEVLRAKVKVFSDLYQNRRELERLNRELEQRVNERTRELENSTRQLVESEQRRTLALAASRMGSWDWDAISGRCTWDEGQCQIAGVDPVTFQPTVNGLQRFLSEAEWERLKSAYLAASENSAQFQTEVEIQCAQGQTKWCILAAAASFNTDGKLLRISGVTIDITDRKHAEERQSLLAREVDHRARNMLAVVQAILKLTKANTTAAYVTAVEGRIRALSLTHSLLSDSHWAGADVERLVQEETNPYSGGDGRSKIVIAGPKTSLTPERAQTLGLALHELATNAAKYGALSVSTGVVEITWTVENSVLLLKWRESKGPKVLPPTHKGFGSKIISSSIRQVGGQVAFDWNAEGLSCAMEIPLTGTRSESSSATRRAVVASNLVNLSATGGRRILLAEDEALVGMMMRDTLTATGFLVLGPLATLDEAIEVAKTQQFDCAILDVNMAGELVYPLAELLKSRGVPFLFMTGYDDAVIDARFDNILVLHKPMDERVLMSALGIRSGAPETDVSAARAAL